MKYKVDRRGFLRAASAGAMGLPVAGVLRAARRKAKRPNILWICAEDMNPRMSCYGDKLLRTPTFDAMAAGGVRFDRAYVPAPVCSACRSAKGQHGESAEGLLQVMYRWGDRCINPEYEAVRRKYGKIEPARPKKPARKRKKAPQENLWASVGPARRRSA